MVGDLLNRRPLHEHAKLRKGQIQLGFQYLQEGSLYILPSAQRLTALTMRVFSLYRITTAQFISKFSNVKLKF